MIAEFDSNGTINRIKCSARLFLGTNHTISRKRRAASSFLFLSFNSKREMWLRNCNEIHFNKTFKCLFLVSSNYISRFISLFRMLFFPWRNGKRSMESRSHRGFFLAYEWISRWVKGELGKLEGRCRPGISIISSKRRCLKRLHLLPSETTLSLRSLLQQTP